MADHCGLHGAAGGSMQMPAVPSPAHWAGSVGWLAGLLGRQFSRPLALLDMYHDVAELM